MYFSLFLYLTRVNYLISDFTYFCNHFCNQQ